MNIYFFYFIAIAILVVAYLPFKYARICWRLAVTELLYWKTPAGVHKLKYCNKSKYPDFIMLAKVARFWLIITIAILLIVAFAEYGVITSILKFYK